MSPILSFLRLRYYQLEIFKWKYYPQKQNLIRYILKIRRKILKGMKDSGKKRKKHVVWYSSGTKPGEK